MNDKCATCETGCSSGQCTDPEVRLPPGMLTEYDLNRSVNDGILLWIETFGDTPVIERSALGMISIAKKTDAKIYGVLFGDVSRKSLYDEIFEYGIDVIYHIRSPELNGFDAESYAISMDNVAERVKPQTVLMPNTDKGKEIASRMRISVTLTDPVSEIPNREEGRKGSAMNMPFRR